MLQPHLGFFAPGLKNTAFEGAQTFPYSVRTVNLITITITIRF